LLTRLFNIIIDNDKTGSTILSHINKMGLPGEITFMPLNRLKFNDVQYPTSPVSRIKQNTFESERFV